MIGPVSNSKQCCSRVTCENCCGACVVSTLALAVIGGLTWMFRNEVFAKKCPDECAYPAAFVTSVALLTVALCCIKCLAGGGTVD